MTRLDRYIGSSVLSAMALVLLVLGALGLVFDTVDALGDTNEQYGTAAALMYVLHLLPRKLYELLPMSALIGALAGLGVLAASNELVAMQAAGISRFRIVVSVMKPTALVMLLGLFLGEVVAPPLEMRGEVEKAMVTGQQMTLSRFGHWERDGASFMHFNAIEPEGILHGVTIFEFDGQQRMTRNITAERAVYLGADLQGQGDLQGLARASDTLASGNSALAASPTSWILENGKETTFVYLPEGLSTQYSTFATQGRDLDLTPQLLRVLIVEPDRMAISELYSYARRFERQGQDASPYYMSFWKKALQPLSTAVLVLLAISFIFGPLREATMGSRLFTAITFGIVFTILQNLLHTLSLLYQYEPLLAVLLPLVLCVALAAILFRRAA